MSVCRAAVDLLPLHEDAVAALVAAVGTALAQPISRGVPIYGACCSLARSLSMGLSEIGSESEKASLHSASRPGKPADSPSRV